MSVEDDIRARWDTAELAGLWTRAREALEAPKPLSTFRLELPDDATRAAVGELVGRPMWGDGTRLSVSKLDARLRENTPSGLGLSDVLAILHGRPVERGKASPERAAEPHDRTPGVLHAALAEQGLDSEPWADPWVAWVRQYGRVAEAELDRLAARSAALLARLVLDPTTEPRGWRARTDLAARYGGGAHELDSGRSLARLVLRAAALAHDVTPPGTERERQALWRRCGVVLDDVSTTGLCWALPVPGDSSWAATARQRTELGLPLHLAHADLRGAPEPLVEPGTVVAVCERARVLEAAARAGITHPLVCTAGQLTTATTELLHRLADAGALLRHHGDFDWSGLDTARSVRAVSGARAWRMSADDYREAVDAAAAERTDLPVLSGESVDAPWDPSLSGLMSSVGRVVDEEVVLERLLGDLRAGLV